MEKGEINENMVREWERSHRRGKLMAGFVLVLAGSLFLARELGVEIPDWVFSWKMLLIGLSLVMLVKHGFRRLGWLVPLAIGAAFIVSDHYPDLSIKPFLWPVILILIGLVIMFKPRRRYESGHWQRRWHDRHQYRAQNSCHTHESTSEDFIDSTSVMGGVKKNILSKQFKGGDITNVFGGTELNLIQADFEGVASLELTQVFGGTKLIVPAHWQIQSTIVTVFGSLEDNRPVTPHTGNDPKKILKLEGTTFCGGIEIKSY